MRADNTAVYAQHAKDAVDDALRGGGGGGSSAFSGQTAAGQGGAMQGTPESPGLIPRAVVDVFETYEVPRVLRPVTTSACAAFGDAGLEGSGRGPGGPAARWTSRR